MFRGLAVGAVAGRTVLCVLCNASGCRPSHVCSSPTHQVADRQLLQAVDNVAMLLLDIVW